MTYDDLGDWVWRGHLTTELSEHNIDVIVDNQMAGGDIARPIACLSVTHGLADSKVCVLDCTAEWDLATSVVFSP